MADDRRQIAEVLAQDVALFWGITIGVESDKVPEFWDRIADALLPLIDRVKAEAAAEALSAAATDALAYGRRGPNSVADWLIDRAIDTRTAHAAIDAQEASTDGR